MDQTEWNTLNQMLTNQAAAGDQQQYVVQIPSTSGSVGRAQRLAGGKITNGAARGTSHDGSTDIVKSLLTGTQYGQSILRPELIKGSQQQKATKPRQQQQMEVASQQQDDISGEGQQFDYGEIAEQVKSGETFLAVVNGVTYQIIDDSKHGLIAQPASADGGSVLPFGSGISLENLANISAEQETLQLNYQAAEGGGDASGGLEGAVAEGDVMSHVVMMDQEGQYTQHTTEDGQTIVTAPDGTQMILLPEGYDAETGQPEAVGTGSVSAELLSGVGGVIKVNGQDFVLQPGQELPPELQEMVAKGLPVDLSNYELIIQDGYEGGEAADGGYAGQQATGLQLQHANAAAVAVPTARTIRTNVVSGSRPTPQRASLNEWFDMTGKTSVLRIPPSKSRPTVSNNSASSLVVTASPGELEDGEFSYLAPTEEDMVAYQAVAEYDRTVPNSGFLETFIGFVQGDKVETLASVASSSVTRKPVLPKYIPEPARNRVMVGQDGSLQGHSIYMGGGERGGKRGRGKRTSTAPGRPLSSTGLEDGEITSLQDSTKRGMDTPRGRGRGRPRGSGHSQTGVVSPAAVPSKVIVVEQEPQPIEPATHVVLNEAHLFQKGDFVIERKDAYKYEFPIWRIENGKLLQKFDPIYRDGQLLHKSASIYSSWSGEIRTNFKAILVEVVSTSVVATGRKQEITVKVLDRYMIRALDDSLEQHPLMEVFNIYVQSILSQSLDPTFLLTLQQQHEEYYEGPMRQLDQLLEQAKQAMLYEITWTDEFRTTVEQLSSYMLASRRSSDVVCPCQAQQDGTTMAVRSVKLYGQVYDRDLLSVTQEVTVREAKEFEIGRPTIEYLSIYHALHHYKFLLYKRCVEEVRYMMQSQTKTDREVLGDCLQNRILIQQLFRELTMLLEKYLIIRAEDSAEDEATTVAMDTTPQNEDGSLPVGVEVTEPKLEMQNYPLCGESTEDSVMQQLKSESSELGILAADGSSGQQQLDSAVEDSLQTADESEQMQVAS